MQARHALQALLLTLVSASTLAAPALQLDITGGTYDDISETIITTERNFSLNAYASAKDTLQQTHFLAVAIMADKGSDSAKFGSFAIGDTKFSFADMVFGNPPFEKSSLGFDAGDLSPHGLYDTWFTEIAFAFSPKLMTKDLNTENTPGIEPSADGNKYYFQTFFVDASGMNAGFNLHFDLYTTKSGKKGDIDINKFAPFSHDAATAYDASEYKVAQPVSAPEPGTLALFGAAIAALGIARRQRA